jgi:hypothetical protein
VRPLSIGITLDSSCIASGSRGIALVREEVCNQRIARTHLPHGSPEPDLGAAYSWRTESARLRHIGANGVALTRKAPRSPELAKRWAAFLDNHGEAIATTDFFTVPTVTRRPRWEEAMENLMLLHQGSIRARVRFRKINQHTLFVGGFDCLVRSNGGRRST